MYEHFWDFQIYPQKKVQLEEPEEENFISNLCTKKEKGYVARYFEEALKDENRKYGQGLSVE